MRAMRLVLQHSAPFSDALGFAPRRRGEPTQGNDLDLVAPICAACSFVNGEPLQGNHADCRIPVVIDGVQIAVCPWPTLLIRCPGCDNPDRCPDDCQRLPQTRSERWFCVATLSCVLGGGWAALAGEITHMASVVALVIDPSH